LTSFAFSVWAWLDATSGNFPQICSPNAGATGADLQLFGIHVGASAGLNLYISGLQSGNTTNFVIGATPVWHHCACRYVSNGAATGTIIVYLDGVDVTNGNSGSISAVPGTNPWSIGAGNAGGNSFWKGYLYDYAIWTAATGVIPITIDEIKALSKGARPFQIRPQNLVTHLPLWGFGYPEPDLSGAVRNGTQAGSVTAGPIDAPVMMFTPRWPMGSILPAPVAVVPPAFPFQSTQIIRKPIIIGY
jgi:hypothetical protein